MANFMENLRNLAARSGMNPARMTAPEILSAAAALTAIVVALITVTHLRIDDGNGHYAEMEFAGSNPTNIKMRIPVPIGTNVTMAYTDYAQTFTEKQKFTDLVIKANDHLMGLKAPSDLAADLDLTLPGTAGSNGQVLTTDGAGVTSWQAAAGGGATATLPLKVTGADVEFGTNIAPTTADVNADSVVGGSNAAKKVMVLQAKANQTANVFEIQKSDGTVVNAISIGNNASGASNCTLGVGAGDSITSGAQNTLIGTNAGTAITTTSDSTCIGFNSGSSATGASNTLVGSGTGATLTTGTSNILIGKGGDVDASGTTSTFVAGSVASPILTAYFGKGMSAATPGGFTLHGTNGVGNDKQGASVSFAVGNSTGTNHGGSFNFYLCDKAAGTSSTSNTSTVRSIISYTGTLNTDTINTPVQTAQGANLAIASYTEEITIGTPGPTTDSTNDLLPANSYIIGVTARVTAILPGSVTWSLGTASTADRFAEALQPGDPNQLTSTWNTGHAAGTGGPTAALAPFVNATAAKVRVTTSGDPGAATGRIRVTVFYCTLTPPAN